MPLGLVNAGRLDKRVTIQSRAEADDGGGGQDVTYSDSRTVWASIEPGAGGEFFKAQQLQPELSHIVRMRHRSGVTEKHRLKYVASGLARVFSIHVVGDPMERHEQLVLFCSELKQT